MLLQQLDREMVLRLEGSDQLKPLMIAATIIIIKELPKVLPEHSRTDI